MRITHHPNRAAWLEARRSGIGGSDSPAILGVSKYATPLSVWTSKVLPPEEDADTYTLARGRYMESFIADRLTGEAGIVIAKAEASPFAIAQSEAHPCLLYSPDAFAYDANGEMVLCEFKSRIRGASEWEEGIPPDVAAQAQHGLDVCGLDVCYVACDTGNELRWARLERDPTWATDVRPKLIAWWHDHVVGEVAPPPSSDDADVLARLYPRHQPGKTIALPGSLAEGLDEMIAAEQVVKAASAKIDEFKNAVRAALGDAECGVLPDGSSVTWKTQERKAYEVKAGTSRVLRFKPRKDR